MTKSWKGPLDRGISRPALRSHHRLVRSGRLPRLAWGVADGARGWAEGPCARPGFAHCGHSRPGLALRIFAWCVGDRRRRLGRLRAALAIWAGSVGNHAGGLDPATGPVRGVGPPCVVGRSFGDQRTRGASPLRRPYGPGIDGSANPRQPRRCGPSDERGRLRACAGGGARPCGDVAEFCACHRRRSGCGGGHVPSCWPGSRGGPAWDLTSSSRRPPPWGSW